MKNKVKSFKDSDDFNDILSDMLSDFLANITSYDIYTEKAIGNMPLTEYEEGIEWYYTQKGMLLIERWHRRMKDIYDKYFDDDNFNPISTMYREF